MNKQTAILTRRHNRQGKCYAENCLGILLHSRSCRSGRDNRWCPFTYFLWNRTTGSASRSVTSSFLPFSITSRCLRTNSHPIWEKKKPRRALWGSASVSEYLWWTRWSLDHSKMSFCRENADLSEGLKHPGTFPKAPQPPLLPPHPLTSSLIYTCSHPQPQSLNLKFNRWGLVWGGFHPNKSISSLSEDLSLSLECAHCRRFSLVE